MYFRPLLLGCVVGLVAFSSPLTAQTALLLNAGTNSVTLRTDGGFTIGTKFTVGAQSLSLTSLGIWDNNSDGLLGSHAAGIWLWSSGTLLGSVTIPSGTAGTLVNGFRYTDLSTPVTLTAGETYYFGAYYNSVTGETFRDATGNNVSTSSFATNYEAAYNVGASLTMATNLGGTGVITYAGPNALVSAIPEPATYAMIAGAAALVGALIRRRLKPANT